VHGDRAYIFGEGYGVAVESFRRVNLEDAGCTEGWVASEVELFRSGEDADANAFCAFLLEGAALDEDGFREVEFAGDGLHLPGVEGSSIEDHGERITLEDGFSEDIDDEVIKLHADRPPYPA